MRDTRRRSNNNFNNEQGSDQRFNAVQFRASCIRYTEERNGIKRSSSYSARSTVYFFPSGNVSVQIASDTTKHLVDDRVRSNVPYRSNAPSMLRVNRNNARLTASCSTLLGFTRWLIRCLNRCIFFFFFFFRISNYRVLAVLLLTKISFTETYRVLVGETLGSRARRSYFTFRRCTRKLYDYKNERHEGLLLLLNDEFLFDEPRDLARRC